MYEVANMLSRYKIELVSAVFLGYLALTELMAQVAFAGSVSLWVNCGSVHRVFCGYFA